MLELFSNGHHMIMIAIESSLVLPVCFNPFSRGTRNRDEMLVEFYPVAVDINQFINTYLRNTGPYTRYIGEIVNTITGPRTYQGNFARPIKFVSVPNQISRSGL